MAQLALGIAGGIAGAAIGGAIGGPIGAQVGGSLGFALGSYVGGQLDPPKHEGPRLADLRLQKSSYGGMLAIVYGAHRLAGNVIWQTDLVEHPHKSGGKGGGAEITNYSYSASFAIALSEGPVDHIRRAWANGRLMYDEEAGSENTSGDFQFAFYPGDEEQLPDPTMQAALGADEVPAYRGTCYVVFTDFDLTDFGNAIPNLEFEVVTRGLSGCAMRAVDANNAATLPAPGPVAITGWSDGYFRLTKFPKGGGSFGSGPPLPSAVSINPTYLYAEDCSFVDDASGTADVFPGEFDLVGPDPANPGFFTDCRFKPLGIYVYADGSTKPLWKSVQHELVSGSTGNVSVGDENTTGNLLDGGSSENPAGDFLFNAGVPSGRYLRSAALTGNGRTLFAFTDTVASRVVGGGTTECMTEWWKIRDGLVIDNGTCSGSLDSLGNPCLRRADFDCYGPAGNYSQPSMCASFDLDGLHCWYVDNDTVRMFTIDATTKDFRRDDVCGAASMGTVSQPSAKSVLAYKKGYAVVYNSDGTNNRLQTFTRFPEGASSAITLGEIVADLSISTETKHRAGLTEEDIDVTELTDLVDGYLINQQGPVRAMIEPLQRGFFFDPAEIDDQIAFRKRGRGIVAVILDTELAARVDGEPAPAPLTLMRAQEVDLPRILNVDYINNQADYQPGTQYAERQAAYSQSKMLINVPVAMGDAKAKAVAATNMTEAWLEREKASISLPRKFAYLTPTDVIQVKDRAWRIKHVVESKPGVFTLDMVPSIAVIYVQPQTSTPSTGIGSGSSGTPPLPKPATELILLDIPLVRSTDPEFGFYAAMAPAAAGPWSGASLQKSMDAGASYAEVSSTPTPSVIGTATTALGDFAGGYVVDHLHRLTVEFTLDTELAGVSRLALLSGANDAVVGAPGRWERISFEFAELTDTNTYKLSNLLRGRSGTEWAMGLHEVGDTFILLPGVVNTSAPWAEIGIPQKYKAVTFGRTIDSASAQDFANQAEALRPFSVAHLGGGRNAAGDLLLDWDRRTRIGGAWKDNVDVPLSEPTEAYVVRIWTDGTYTTEARAFTSGTQETVYLASEQTADFGSPQATVYVSVEQVGQYRNSPETRAAL